MLGSEMCDKDCPKARSGGASFAAARVLKVPPQQMVIWMKRAEQLFAQEVRIVWLPATRPETFVEWLGAARRAQLEYVPTTATAQPIWHARLLPQGREQESGGRGEETSGGAHRTVQPMAVREGNGACWTSVHGARAKQSAGIAVPKAHTEAPACASLSWPGAFGGTARWTRGRREGVRVGVLPRVHRPDLGGCQRGIHPPRVITVLRS